MYIADKLQANLSSFCDTINDLSFSHCFQLSFLLDINTTLCGFDVVKSADTKKNKKNKKTKTKTNKQTKKKYVLD